MTTPTAPVKRKLLTLGPGSLVIGSIGTPLDMSCQLTAFSIEWEVDAEDAEPTLCGDLIGGARTYTATAKGTVFQDIETDGVIDYSWKHKGTEAPFKFVTDETNAAAVTGRLIIDPITLGGDVRTRNKSDFEWQCVGDPVFNPTSNEGSTAAEPGTSG
ncbi:hypothetical protein M3B20_01365 [Corynebacterium sanguinis]|uniref:hypothetical protein n=1 Tax=Corynebacterium sanguinis TaxID=2594913 RepID=UPI0021A5DBA2|nr:hypothetical protein [Corynebacterium sanguinis]MCT1804384.1 hypothetical protein [Corynebacterium sanguinis]